MSWLNQPSEKSFSCNKQLLKSLRSQFGWSQSEVARRAGYSERLVNKAEAGERISVDAICDLSRVYSSQARSFYPEDFVADHVLMAKQYIEALYLGQKNALAGVRHFVADDIEVVISGDPAVLPFAGHYHGVASLNEVLKKFFDCFVVPPSADYVGSHDYFVDGTDVVVWGSSSMHPVGTPAGGTRPFQQRLSFRRGRLCRLVDRGNALSRQRAIERED